MDNDNIIDYSGNADFFYIRFKKLMDKKEYFSALQSLRRAAETEQGYKYKLAVGEFFFKFELYSLAETQYYTVLSKYAAAKSECFAALSQLYYSMDDNYNGMGYFNRFLNENDGVFMDDDESYYEAMDGDSENDYENYKLVYPLSDDQYFEIIEEAKAAIAKQKYDMAKDILESVPKTSAAYYPAQNNLALSRLFVGDVETSIDIVENNLSDNPDDIFSLCTACSVYRFAGLSERSAALSEKLKNAETEDEYLLYKIAATFCEMENDEYALKFLKKLLEMKPLDPKSMRLIVIALFNLKRYEESREWLLNQLILEENDLTVKGYLTLIDQITAYGFQSFRLPYMIVMPPAIREPLVKLLKRLQKDKNLTKQQCEAADFKELFTFSLEEEEGKYLPMLLERFGSLDNIQDYITEALISIKVSVKNKRKILYTLAKQSYKGALHLVLFREYSLRTMRYPRGFYKFLPVWQEAYCLALSALLTYHDDLTRQFSRNTHKLYDIAEERKIEIKDAQTLAAVLLYMTAADKFISPMAALHEDIKFSSKDFKILLQQLKDEDVNDETL